MAREVRSLAEEADYVSNSLPSIERRSLMESGMRRKTRSLSSQISFGRAGRDTWGRGPHLPQARLRNRTGNLFITSEVLCQLS